MAVFLFSHVLHVRALNAWLASAFTSLKTLFKILMNESVGHVGGGVITPILNGNQGGYYTIKRYAWPFFYSIDLL